MAYFVFFLIGKALEEGNTEVKEPESTTHELAMFGWVRTWMEEEGSSVLKESYSQSLLTQALLNPSLLVQLAASVLCSLLPMVHNFLGLLRLPDLLQGLHQLCQPIHLWQDAEGLKKIELTMDGSKAEGFCIVLQVARTPEPSTSGDPHSSMRCTIASSTIASDQTDKEHKGVMPEWGNPTTAYQPTQYS